MARRQYHLTLTWRDESYGSVYAEAAFRTAVAEDMSDTAEARLARAFRVAGFRINHDRAAWVAERFDRDRFDAMQAKLEEMGFVIAHRGAVPPWHPAANRVSTDDPIASVAGPRSGR